MDVDLEEKVVESPRRAANRQNPRRSPRNPIRRNRKAQKALKVHRKSDQRAERVGRAGKVGKARQNLANRSPRANAAERTRSIRKDANKNCRRLSAYRVLFLTAAKRLICMSQAVLLSFLFSAQPT